MRIVITGGAGFVGSALAAHLRTRSHEVWSFDLFPPTGQQERLVSIDKPDDVMRAFDELPPIDVVYHLAGPVAETSRKRPAEATSLQIQGTLNVMEAARRFKIRRVVLASSFYVFANYPAGAVVNEESALDVMGLEIFGAAKAMSERIVRQYAQSYQIEWAAGRFGSIYGYNPCPTAKGSNAVRTFIELGLKGQPLEVWGPGNRRNQYTLLKDVVDGLELLATSEQGAYNLISPEETTTGELARFLETRYGFQVVFNLERPEGASMAYMSARKAIRDLGWLHTPLAKGIEETVTALQDQA